MKTSKGVSKSNVAMTGNRGRVGNVRFVTKGEKTYTRTVSSRCSNPRSRKQMLARVKMLNIQNHWQYLKPFLQDHFENRTPTVSAYNLFTKRSAFCAPVYLEKYSIACVSAPYGVSEGSLPAIGYAENQDGVLVSTIKLGDDFIPDETTTVGEMAERIVTLNPDFDYGDEVEFFGTEQVKGNNPSIDVHCEVLKLEEGSQELLFADGREWGYKCVDGALAMSQDAVAGCYGWIHIRRNDRTEEVRVSTQDLFNRNRETLQRYSSEEAFCNASSSFGSVQKPLFVDPGTATCNMTSEVNTSFPEQSGRTVPKQRGKTAHVSKTVLKNENNMKLRTFLIICFLLFTFITNHGSTKLPNNMLSADKSDTFSFGTAENPDGVAVEVDSKGIIIGGRHLLPVMGEIHYSRVPEADWLREIRKMKAGGVTVIATYVFWIHHEPVEGQWNWSGNLNLHRFLSLCKQEEMPVVLRLGPFCHGEVYQGGFPEWIVEKAQKDPRNYKLRSQAKGFMEATQRLYSNIYAQASDMLWKHGGPVIGVQLENECRGPWSYYMALKKMAVSIGFDTPFYTRTGWPKLNGKEEFGQMLPLYGDYADGFWERSLKDMPGSYPESFIMKDTRLSRVIATETFGSNQDTQMDKSDMQYPYLTCELGGGMMPAYHRRINMTGNEAFPMAICKLGSGSNLPGYYMYHGGSNPYNPRHTMAECQATVVTNYNDMPHISYDFQCQLGEMGQPNLNAFHQTRWLHQFLADWGEELSQYDVDSLSEHYARRGCFVFRNDYVRILNEGGTASVTPQGMKWQGLTMSSSSVQPFAKLDDTIYFITVKGSKRYQVDVDGKKITLKPDKPVTIKGKRVILLSKEKARTAFVIDGRMHYAKHDGILYKADSSIVEEYWTEAEEFKGSRVHELIVKQTREAAPAREIRLGSQKVAEQPSEQDFDAAAVYSIDLDAVLSTSDAESSVADMFLEVSYKGDVARIYADGQLVEDNFWNGKPMLVRLADIIGKKVELRILPLRKDAPIYLQKEQRSLLNATTDTLLSLDGVKILRRNSL